MELPQPEYVGMMAGEDSGGARSPKYPSTVTKVSHLISAEHIFHIIYMCWYITQLRLVSIFHNAILHNYYKAAWLIMFRCLSVWEIKLPREPFS